MLPKLFKICVFVVSIQVCYAPPVKEETKKVEDEGEQEGIENYMEYHRYLSEIVQALESDPDFKEKLQKAPEDDIRSGKIADQLEFVSHHVRTKLDEIKRVELERLKKLVERKKELQENIDKEDPTHRHVDHSNPHTFEINDLKKLIAKTQEDLAKADQLRKEEFKQYEMQKEYEKQLKLNATNGDERAKLEKEMKEEEEKHKKHEKLHEPGHKAQLEEVWQEEDHMDQEFNPKTFFMLHDIDSNGLLDQFEVKALFVKEMEKLYPPGSPNVDMREKVEEMERMRESVFQQADTNRDGFIDFQEFLAQTQRSNFEEDRGWNGIDEQKQYTDEELQEYISRHQMQHPPPVQYQQQQFHPGQMPQHPPQQIPAHHPNAIPQHGYQQQHYDVHQQQQQYHPNQGYQQHQQFAQGNPQQHQYQQGNVPQQQYHQGNVQHQQYPQGNVQQNQQFAQGNQQQQVPQGNQQQQQQYQIPQGNVQQNQQVPQGNQQQQQGLNKNAPTQHVNDQSNQIPHQGAAPVVNQI